MRIFLPLAMFVRIFNLYENRDREREMRFGVPGAECKQTQFICNKKIIRGGICKKNEKGAALDPRRRLPLRNIEIYDHRRNMSAVRTCDES